MSGESIAMMAVIIGFYVSGFVYLINLAFNKKEV